MLKINPYGKNPRIDTKINCVGDDDFNETNDVNEIINQFEIDKQKIPLQELKSYLSDLNDTKGFFKSIKVRHDDGLVSVIAEIKRASPSQGLIRENFNPKDIAKSYQASQATCLSVLTDTPYFKGSLDNLAAVREVVELPLLK